MQSALLRSMFGAFRRPRSGAVIQKQEVEHLFASDPTGRTKPHNPNNFGIKKALSRSNFPIKSRPRWRVLSTTTGSLRKPNHPCRKPSVVQAVVHVSISQSKCVQQAPNPGIKTLAFRAFCPRAPELVIFSTQKRRPRQWAHPRALPGMSDI